MPTVGIEQCGWGHCGIRTLRMCLYRFNNEKECEVWSNPGILWQSLCMRPWKLLQQARPHHLNATRLMPRTLQLVRNAPRLQLQLILWFQGLKERRSIAHWPPRRLTRLLEHQPGMDTPVEITACVSGEPLDHSILLHQAF